jgi:hypothetical protein
VALAEDTADAPPPESELSDEDDSQTEASAQGGAETAEENPTKED